MANYEYKVVWVDQFPRTIPRISEQLNKYAADGWELVGHVEPVAYNHNLWFVATMRRERQEGQEES